MNNKECKKLLEEFRVLTSKEKGPSPLLQKRSRVIINGKDYDRRIELKDLLKTKCKDCPDFTSADRREINKK